MSHASFPLHARTTAMQPHINTLAAVGGTLLPLLRRMARCLALRMQLGQASAVAAEYGMSFGTFGMEVCLWSIRIRDWGRACMYHAHACMRGLSRAPDSLIMAMIACTPCAPLSFRDSHKLHSSPKL